jgi:hypothetical protein
MLEKVPGSYFFLGMGDEPGRPFLQFGEPYESMPHGRDGALPWSERKRLVP